MIRAGNYRRPKRHARPEQAIQKAVFQHLSIRAAPGVFAWHCPNGGKRSPVEAAIFKGLGVLAGVPDVLAVKDGRLFALELKAPGGHLTGAQEDVLRLLSRAGATAGTAWGLDDALAWLEDHKLLRRNVA